MIAALSRATSAKARPAEAQNEARAMGEMSSRAATEEMSGRAYQLHAMTTEPKMNVFFSPARLSQTSAMRGFRNQGIVRRLERYEICAGEIVPASTARIPSMGTTAHQPRAILHRTIFHCSATALSNRFTAGRKVGMLSGSKRSGDVGGDKGGRTVRQKSINAYLQDGEDKTRQQIREGIERAAQRPPPDISSMQSVLVRIPNADRLAKLTGPSHPPLECVEVVSKEWEDSFLVPPGPGQRACVCGDKCESKQLAEARGMPQPFVMKEFYTPSEMRGGPVSGGTRPRMCLLCHRREILVWYWRHVVSKTEPPLVLNRWRNVCGLPGTYSEEAMIMQAGTRWRGVLGHFVRHNRDAFEMEITSEGPRLVQVGVGFRPPPA